MTNFFTTTQWCIIIYMISSVVCRWIIKVILKLYENNFMPNVSERAKVLAKSILKTLPFIPVLNTIYAAFVIIAFILGGIFKK